MKDHIGFDEVTIRLIFFVEIDLPSGIFRANTSDRNIVIGEGDDAITYFAVGSLGSIGQYDNTSGVEATSVKLALTGISQSDAIIVANEKTRNKPVSLYLALADEGNLLLTDLIKWFYGTIDSATMDIGQIVSISASASSRLINWARAINSRYTNEDQQQKHPGDKGFQFVSQIPNLKISWGQ